MDEDRVYEEETEAKEEETAEEEEAVLLTLDRDLEENDVALEEIWRVSVSSRILPPTTTVKATIPLTKTNKRCKISNHWLFALANRMIRISRANKEWEALWRAMNDPPKP